MHNIYQYLNNPVETFFFFHEKIHPRWLPTLRERKWWSWGKGARRSVQLELCKIRIYSTRSCEVSSPWVSTVCEKWTHQNCSIKYGHKKLLSSSPMQAHHAGWVGSPMLELLRPGASPSPAPPPGSHLQSRVTCFQCALSSQWWAWVSSQLRLLWPPTKKKGNYRAWKVPDLSGTIDTGV